MDVVQSLQIPCTYLTMIETMSTATPRGIGTANTCIPFLLYCTSTDISSTPKQYMLNIYGTIPDIVIICVNNSIIRTPLKPVYKISVGVKSKQFLPNAPS